MPTAEPPLYVDCEGRYDAAANVGYEGIWSSIHACAAKYISKLSGPLLDRIDLQIEIARVPFDDMVRRDGAERSPAIRDRVVAARTTARKRFADTPIGANAEISATLMRTYCALDDERLDHRAA